jgi:ABC-2 type transport system permease protein
MTQPATLAWFASHELRLSWRDWLSMMTAGQRWRQRNVAIALLLFGAFLHLIALMMVGPFADAAAALDKATLVAISGSALLAWSLMASQAMESVTRAFYSRSDLDLILSSPTAARKLFAVRIATMALSIILMAVLLAAPFINVLAWRGGAHWLGAYAVAAALGATAAAIAVALTVALFRLIGPKRTRLIAQVVAAVIGAGFVIGLQMAAILSYGTLSRSTVLGSDRLVALLPGVDSPLWWPARASDRRRASAPPRRAGRSVARNGCCSSATRGWCRRR